MLPTIPSGNVTSGLATGYDVANSCRFDGSSAYMHKTPGSAGNRRTFTLSAWVKRGAAGETYHFNGTIFGGGTGTGEYLQMYIALNKFVFLHTGPTVDLKSTALLRDHSAWYNLIVAVDTTQAVEANRVKMYINGTQVTSFSTSTYPSQNDDLYFGQDEIMSVGTLNYTAGLTDYMDGYMAELVYIDGLQLTPTSFGEFDEDSPTIWKPIDVSGLTFGTNGFYCDYEDSANLGNDANGGTDLTEVNLAATDQATDTPTNNFATMNPLHIATSASPTFSQGNLQIVTPVSGAGVCVSTIGATSGKWYAEVYVAAYASLDRTCVAITGDANGTITANTNIGSLTTSLDVGYFGPDGDKFVGNSETSYGATYAVDDIIGIALNIDDNEVTFYKNNSSQGAISFTAGGTYHFALGDVSDGGGNTLVINFGQEGSFAGETTAQGNADGNGYGDFYYSPPSGFLALCTKNLGSDGG